MKASRGSRSRVSSRVEEWKIHEYELLTTILKKIIIFCLVVPPKFFCSLVVLQDFDKYLFAANLVLLMTDCNFFHYSGNQNDPYSLIDTHHGKFHQA